MYITYICIFGKYIYIYKNIFMFSECKQFIPPLVRNQRLDSPNALNSKTLEEKRLSQTKTETTQGQEASIARTKHAKMARTTHAKIAICMFSERLLLVAQFGRN